MRQDIDTRKIRHKVYMSYFQDGLWDIVLGLFLIGWGLAVMLDIGWLPGVSFVTFFWLALGLKQKITYPRIGYSKPAGQRKQMSRIIIAGVVTLLLGVMLFLLAVTGGTPQFLNDYFELLFGTMLAIIIGLIAYWWGIARWYVFAGLVFTLAAINQWSELSFELSFFIPGGIVLACGTFVLFRFLRDNPRVSAEDINGTE